MMPSDLDYQSLKNLLEPIELRTGLGESAAFLVWFLENVYRLEDTDARDAVCDRKNDKGIDGIYIDENTQEIHFLQAKLRQGPHRKVGDVGPKTFMASVHQFKTSENVKLVLDGNADAELKRLIERTRLSDFVALGYKLKGIYVTNETQNADSEQYENLTEDIVIWDREAIAPRVVDIDTSGDKKEKFSFDTSYVEPMKMLVGAGATSTSMYVFPARALQLVHMEGIADSSLFRDNVRYSLGNTAVNKSITKTIAEKTAHPNFVLFHNGIIVLCSKVDSTKPDFLTVEDYTVVNGAQSLTTFYNNKAKLSEDLRVMVRIVELQDDALSRKITEYSNNQNAIRPRDLRSNHSNMLRIQKEMQSELPGYFFEIKRGESAPPGVTIIANDDMGRALLAFDVQEPWSAHQIYKVFDEKYNEIYGRREVTAKRVVFIHQLMTVVETAMVKITNRPMASYTLTKYFIAYLMSRILRSSEAAICVMDPSVLDEAKMRDFLQKCSEILKTVIVDLNYEEKVSEFDYKTVFKSPKQSTDLADRILTSYEKDVARDRAESFEGWVVRP